MRSLLFILGLALVVSGSSINYGRRNGVHSKREASPQFSAFQQVQPFPQIPRFQQVSLVEQYLDSCMASLENGVAAMAPEIQAIMDSTAQFPLITEPAQIIRQMADIVRHTQSLGEKLDLRYVETCLPREVYSSIKSQTKAFSSVVSQLGSSFTRSLCSADNSFNININKDAIATIGDQLELMAAMVGSFGDERTGQKVRETIRYWIEYAQRITVQLESLDLAQYFRGCSNSSISTVADTMDDLANILEEIGFENLLNQLGVDFSFDVNV